MLMVSCFSCRGNSGECRIIDANFIPMIKGEVNGRCFYFLVDTGASISVVDYESIRKEFPNKHIGAVEDGEVQGYGGTVGGLRPISLKVISGTLRFNREWKAKDISNIINVANRRTGRRVLGVVGNNNLRGKVIDLGDRRIYYATENNN